MKLKTEKQQRKPQKQRADSLKDQQNWQASSKTDQEKEKKRKHR